MVCCTVRLPYYRMLLQLPNTVLKLTMPSFGVELFPSSVPNAMLLHEINTTMCFFLFVVLFCFVFFPDGK